MFTPEDIAGLNQAKDNLSAVLDNHHRDLDLQTISFLCSAIQNIDMATRYVADKFSKGLTQ